MSAQTNEIIEAESDQTAVTTTGPDTLFTPSQILGRALETGAGVEVIEKLMALQERWEANQARKNFNIAMADLRPDLPAIVKNNTVDFRTQKGRTQYKYEDLNSLVNQLSPVLTKHGFTFRWQTDSDDKGLIKVTCLISHKDGHYEETSLSGMPDTTGNKNPVQSVGSTVTYLQRYTLKAALGVAAGLDDDGSGGPDIEKPQPKISDDECGVLSQKLESTGADTAKFCEYYKIETLRDLPVSALPHAMKALQRKAKKEEMNHVG